MNSQRIFLDENCVMEYIVIAMCFVSSSIPDNRKDLFLLLGWLD